jgi:hypothetical protein
VTSKAALFALLAVWGVGTCFEAPAIAEDAVSNETADRTPLKRGFTNRVWVKTDSGDLPGVMRIFLSDGTLVQDSCWETHRLSKWTLTGDSGLSWNEDGMDIAASIISVNSTQMHIQLKLGNDTVDEHYTSATVPYVCPDIPKS